MYERRRRKGGRGKGEREGMRGRRKDEKRRRRWRDMGGIRER
jgi:hypothetical protein